MQRVSSSTSERSPLKREAEESPRVRKMRRHSPLHVEVDLVHDQGVLELDFNLPITHPDLRPSPTVQVNNFVVVLITNIVMGCFFFLGGALSFS